MKKTLSLLAIVCFYVNVMAQPATQIIRGIVVDSAKNQPLGYVTVALQTAKTSVAVKSMLSKDNGSFEFNNLPLKDYKVILASVGYNNKVVMIDSTQKLVDLGKVKLSVSAKNLNEVTVTALKPIVKQEVDRIGYDVQADPESKSQTALEMLRKVPLVSVDGSDNIKLKGNTDFKILINGKPSALVAKNPSDVLKAMPASNIEKIEVITTPPAKYEAEGLAGIINIITKKNADQGYNGSISARYNNIYGPATNLNATVKQGKFGLNGYVGYNKQNKQTTSFSNSTTTFHPIASSVDQHGERTNRSKNTYGSAELSYEIDSLNLLSGSVESYRYSFTSLNDQFSTQYNGDRSVNQLYRLLNSGDGSYKGTDLSVNYQLGFKHNKDQLLTASYKYSNGGNKQDNDNQFVQRIGYNMPNFRQYNKSGSKEQTMQLDYVQPFKKLNLEAGAKAILRNSFSDFTSDNLVAATNQYINDPTQTNNFDYKQDVYSVYNSYQLKLEKWTAKAGLRLEHTTVDANFTSIGSVANQDYHNFIPSVSIQRTFKGSSLNFGYSDRISRPNIWQLNPFVDKSNPKYINVGNPGLRPVVNHSLELNYSRYTKGSINAGLSYSFADNTIQNVTTIGTDTVSRSTFQNVGHNKRLGLNVNLNYPLTKKLNINVNSQILHVWLEGTYNSVFYKNQGLQGYIFSNMGYKFEKGWRVGLDFSFDSRYVMLQGKDNYYLGGGVNASKDFWKDKANISIYVRNPYQKYQTFDNYTKTDDFESRNSNQQYARMATLSFTYKFGRLNSSIKKNQRGINNDDSSGRGGNH